MNNKRSVTAGKQQPSASISGTKLILLHPAGDDNPTQQPTGHVPGPSLHKIAVSYSNRHNAFSRPGTVRQRIVQRRDSRHPISVKVGHRTDAAQSLDERNEGLAVGAAGLRRQGSQRAQKASTAPATDGT